MLDDGEARYGSYFVLPQNQELFVARLSHCTGRLGGFKKPGLLARILQERGLTSTDAVTFQ
jgi:hypothetical protein